MPDVMPKTELCRSCRKPIFWATTDKGNPMPLDVDPYADGNVIVHPTETGLAASVLNHRQAVGARMAGWSTYKSHFVYCPSADKYRGRGK